MKISDPQTFEAILAARFNETPFGRLADLPDPFMFLGMDRAADRLAAAVRSGEKITIAGDYDADGVCASAILHETLRYCGVEAEVIIPDRFSDGYGLSVRLIDRVESGVVVTVDNGIAAHDAALRAKEKGLTLIVTDHHLCGGTLPDAYAVVNPKQPGCPFPFKEPCGATVAWYLGAALKSRLGAAFNLADQLDLLMLATLADSVPLVGLNRTLARSGLEKLNASKRPCVLALRAFLDKTVFVYDDVAFQIAPRLNAAGRMEHARAAFDFLSAETFEGALKNLQTLDRLNRARKETESRILEAAQAQIDPASAALVAHGEGWHEGVIGIVAARLAQRFKRPSVVIAHEHETAKGSARTVGDVDLYALIAGCQTHLSAFGGHKKAAGIKLSPGDIGGFKAAFLEAAARIDPAQLAANGALIGELSLALITPELCELMGRYEPFGEGNPQPLFLADALAVLEAKIMGKEGQHLRLRVGQDLHGPSGEAVAFFTDRSYRPGQRASFYYTVSLNEFNGSRRAQMSVSEFL